MNANKILFVISSIILIVTIFNVVTYYKDVKTIQNLNKEKLRLEIERTKFEIEVLKNNNLNKKQNGTKI